MNVNKLKGKIVENGLNVTLLAEKIGIDRATLYRKLNDRGERLTIKEANAIVEILDLTEEESTAIFFSRTVASGAKK